MSALIEQNESEVLSQFIDQIERFEANKISKADYVDAIEKLVGLAQSGTGGSRVAAQVLLSAFNGHNYQLSIPDLAALDADHYDAALAVIRGRTELKHEPHELIDDGHAVFDELQRKWLPELYITCRAAKFFK